jgi:hypothetical protein
MQKGELDLTDRMLDWYGAMPGWAKLSIGATWFVVTVGALTYLQIQSRPEPAKCECVCR